mgnify:CR=1 FL=1
MRYYKKIEIDYYDDIDSKLKTEIESLWKNRKETLKENWLIENIDSNKFDEIIKSIKNFIELSDQDLEKDNIGNLAF